MSSITELSELLATMTPRLHDGRYVFLTVDAATAATVDPLMTFVEDEGTTVVVTIEQAEELGTVPDFVAAWITLEVHSALDAVGLTAAVSAALTDADISCNVVAAFFHDHLFVPHADAAGAMSALRALSESSSRTTG